MTAPIKTATEHPRFSGAETEPPPRKSIDTSAARERIQTARNAEKASDKPPSRRTTKSKDAPTPKPDIPYTNGMFKGPIALVYGQAGQMISYVAYPVGAAIVEQAPACGDAWDKVAKTNPTVRRWLANLTKTGAWGELFAAHLPIAMAAMITFGPQSFRDRMGVVVADSMEHMAGDPGHTVQDPN